MTTPMFDQGPRRGYELSQLCATPTNLRKDDTVRWTTLKSAKAPTCDECAARAWETHGSERPTVARVKRTVRTAHLLLCHPHAQLWKARDNDD